MERLTEHHYNKTMGAHMVCSGACIDDDFDCNDCKKLAEIVDRLAAYEDTGLEPEEITTEPYGCVFYCNRKCNLDGDFCAEGPGCRQEINADEAKRLLMIAQAEKDGRLVVLPCKVGDTVWMIVNKRPKIHMPEFSFVKKSRLTWNNVHRILEAFGKTVFLTRAEAEAALERRKEETK